MFVYQTSKDLASVMIDLKCVNSTDCSKFCCFFRCYPQTLWKKAVVGCWCTVRQASPAQPPSVWPTSCTRSASASTRPSTLSSSGATSSPPIWLSWDSCCSLRPTSSVRDETSDVFSSDSYQDSTNDPLVQKMVHLTRTQRKATCVAGITWLDFCLKQKLTNVLLVKQTVAV